MQRSLKQTTETIKNLPYGIAEKIWNFYCNFDYNQQQNHKELIDEFKLMIQSAKTNIDYGKFKKCKSVISSALQKKKHFVNEHMGPIYHHLHRKYCSHTHMRETHLTSLDIFTIDMEEKFLVFTFQFQELLFDPLCDGIGRRVWRKYPKKNFIIKYLLFNYCQEYYLDNTCSGIIKKSGKRCSCWLKPNCTRCAKHNFK